MRLTLHATDSVSARQYVKRIQLYLSLMILVIAVALQTGGLAGWSLIGVCVAGVVAYAQWSSRDRPMFDADRQGFRLFGGRKRPWSDYGGVSVSLHKPFGEPEQQTLRINLASGSGFRQRRLVTVEGGRYGDELAQKIMAFERKVSAVERKEAGRFDLGAAPVVAAKAGPTEGPWYERFCWW